MSGNNAYLKKRDDRNQAFLDAGEDMGMQKMWDYVQIALRDPKVMGKDVFGRKRLEKLYKKVDELAEYYKTAFTFKVDADKLQRDFDAQLKEVWQEDLCPFYERYPYLKKITYEKAKKGWVE
jgi:hypothetical protein